MKDGPLVLRLKRGGYRILVFQVTEHISASFSRVKTQTVSVPGLVTTRVIITCSLDLLPAPLAWPTTCQRIWIMRTQGNAIKETSVALQQQQRWTASFVSSGCLVSGTRSGGYWVFDFTNVINSHEEHSIRQQVPNVKAALAQKNMYTVETHLDFFPDMVYCCSSPLKYNDRFIMSHIYQ